MGPVTGTKEPFDPTEETVAMVAPANALAGPESLSQLRFVGKDSGKREKASSHVDRALLVGEHRGLFWGEREFFRTRIISYESGSGLCREPFADIALMSAGPDCELGSGQRPSRRKAPIESELFANQHQDGVCRRAEFVHHCPYQRFKLRRVQVHDQVRVILLFGVIAPHIAASPAM